MIDPFEDILISRLDLTNPVYDMLNMVKMKFDQRACKMMTLRGAARVKDGMAALQEAMCLKISFESLELYHRANPVYTSNGESG